MDLKELRRAAGLTQYRVAKKLFITQGAVSKWESGESELLAKYHKRLAKMYGCTQEDIERAARETGGAK